MKFLTNCIGFMAILCVVDASWADRAGPTVSTVVTGADLSRGAVRAIGGGNSKSRLAAIHTIGSSSVGTTTSTNKNTTTTMTDQESIDAYLECIRSSDACGSDFVECTTKTLFYAKKPQCNNALMQCSTAAITSLFGVGNTTLLSNKDSNDEYLYPTDGSMLGQFIEAGAISNRLDTTNCVKKYTSCLKKESVCGEEFSSCTDNNEFKKQKVYCESILARCQPDGVRELFGSENRAAVPAASSRIGVMIKEGGDLAAVNAVTTCYKVADQCFTTACEQNPFKCIVDSDELNGALADAVDKQKSGAGHIPGKDELLKGYTGSVQQKSDVNKFVRGACLDTIGGNKYCYMTAHADENTDVSKLIPTASQLIDPDNRDEVFQAIYSSRMLNPVMQSNLQALADKFDKKTKDKCFETLSSCAMRACGGGVGSACYVSVQSNTGKSINDGSAYSEVKNACEALVNTDATCQYAAKDDPTYKYSETTAFGILFPPFSEGKEDKIGVVGKLNARLSSAYNPSMINKFADQCRNTVTSCVKSMCGKDYKNCYRNRTDILSDTYNTDSDSFNNSMNKVGGVLDFTIVTGLCMDTVRNSKPCEEHFGIMAAAANANVKKEDDSWGGASSVREGWVDAVSGGYGQGNNFKEVTGDNLETGMCRISDEAAQSENCKDKVGVTAECNYVDEAGCIYDTAETVTRKEYMFRMNANTLFREALADAEKAAQAQYNAKITKEQNACLAQNNGGVLARNDMTGSTYQWVKLKSSKVPKNYSTMGLAENSFVTSNDLYGSFCRARVTVQSDDPDIQQMLQSGQKWSTAYFAVGDAFTCGSWIPQADLAKIAEAAGCKSAGYEYKNGKCDVKLSTEQKWAVAASTIGAAGVGYGVTELLQKKTGLGGLLGTTNKISKSSDRKKLEEAWGAWEGFKDSGKVLCGSNSTTDESNAGMYKNCYNIKSDGVVGGFVIKKPSSCSTNCAAVDSSFTVDGYIDKLKEKLQINDDGSTADKKTWIASTAVSGAAALATGLGVGLTMKAKNNEKLTEAQKEWLDQVGSHIICYVGPDEAGTYGDVIEIGLE